MRGLAEIRETNTQRTNRDALGELLADNAVLIHNVLLADARNLEKDTDKANNDADRYALKQWATYRRDLAVKIYDLVMTKEK
jgi:hypothetical protein